MMMNIDPGASTTALISLDALKHNLSILRKLTPQSKILAVVKANAYGHGMLTIACALQSVDAFAVAQIKEAEMLRQQHANKPIVLLQGFLNQAELVALLALNIEPVVHSLSQISLLEKTELPPNFYVWLKVDTGMNRLGLQAEDLPEAWLRLNRISSLQGNIRLMSHFANADDPENKHTQGQMDLFEQITDSFSAEKSLANSAGLMAWPSSHHQWVRPGLMLYGVSPFLDRQASHHNLKPVMTLKSSIIAINHIKKSQAVGYGSNWRASQDTQLAVVACGYGDGYPRHIEDGTPVLINGKLYPIVGSVSMDMITVDLGHTHQVKVGDSATLWGQGLPVENIAKKAGTIAYELLCQITARVQFEISDHGKN